MANLFVARQSGTVMLYGRRHSIQRGVTVAEEGSDMVSKNPRLFEPLRVHYPAAVKRGKPAAVEQATAAPGERRVMAPVFDAPNPPDPDETFACDQCEKTSKSPAGLAAHKRRAHTEGAEQE